MLAEIPDAAIDKLAIDKLVRPARANHVAKNNERYVLVRMFSPRKRIYS